tara:strand:+ start:1069 stop:2379 length:1311 start_codon:yes stop_codon:yes gene_type:complete
MKVLNKYLLKELTAPFFTTFFVLIFVLLSQFILKNLDRFLGKGLSFSVIIKFLFLNSAWIISLAIPMAVLVTTLITFGKLSSNNEITAFKASGIAYNTLLKPCLVFSFTILLLLIPYNLWLLPEMNHEVRNLSYKISKNRPDIEFNENMLNTLSDKTIYLGDRINSNSFSNVIIFDNAYNNSLNTIMADAGEFISMKDGILLNLNQGSIHENSTVNKEYRKTFFNNYKIAIPFDELGYNDANNLVRQEREMNIHLLMEKNDYFKKKKAKEKNDLVKNNKLLISLNDSIKFLNKETKNILTKNKLNKKINITKKKIEKNKRLIPIYAKETNKFAVEIHKKFSVPFACIIFVLLGMPLGILAKKSNMGVSVSISLVVFIIYWCFLILGEELADNTIINPIIAMWAPNIFLALLSYYLYSLISKENITLKINLTKFFKK